MESQRVIIGELSEAIQQELKAGAQYVLEASYESTLEGYSMCKEVESLIERFPKVLALYSEKVHTVLTRSYHDIAQKCSAVLRFLSFCCRLPLAASPGRYCTVQYGMQDGKLACL